MMYVDLNPVRAGMCDDIESSDFTSIQARIKQYKIHKQLSSVKVDNKSPEPQQPNYLLPFGNHQNTKTIAFTLYDYLELIDWSGRAISPNKRGAINSNTPKLLQILDISSDDWIEVIINFRRQYGNFAGSKARLRQCANEHGHYWYKGVG